MDTKLLKQKILDLAIRGKLVPQDPNDEPASVLLERIRVEREKLIAEGKLKRSKKTSENRHYENSYFDLPNGWAIARIDDVAFVTKLAGFEYTKYIANNISSEKGVPLFKGKNVKDGEIEYQFESFIPEEISDSLFRSQITKKCLLTPYVGTLGNIGIHDKEGKYHLGSNVGKIELFNNHILNITEEYVKFYLLSNIGYKELTKHKKATAQESISIDAIRDVVLLIPPLAEQKRIVTEIEKWFSIIEAFITDGLELQETIKLTKLKVLDLAIHGKLVEQYPNDEPARDLLKHIAPDATPCDNSHYGQLPPSWCVVKLGDIGKWQAGGTPKRSTKEYYGGDIPWLKTGDLNDGFISYIPEHITQAGLDNSSAKLNPKGSIMVAMYGATIGKIGILTFPAATNQACCACIDYPTVDMMYLFYFLLSHRDKFIAQGGGGAQPNISKEIIVNTQIPLPPLAEQKRIALKVTELFAILDDITEKL